MGLVQRIVMAISICAWVVVLLASGFFLCLLPPVTHGIATVFANDPDSPFDRTQLVAVADATRDYAFGSHNIDALYATIAEVNGELEENMKALGANLSGGIGGVGSAPNQNYASTKEALSSSDVYSFGADVISHLDDCFKLVNAAYGFVGCAFILALATLIVVRLLWGKKAFATILMASSACVLLVLILAALWTVLDFQGFFNTFHTLFFVEGNWSFPATSLLICALPTGFWLTMGMLWFLASGFVSLAILITSMLLRRGAKG